MVETCKGITLAGRPCRRKIKTGNYCFQHCGLYRQQKPSECIICCESLDNQKRALACGHWVHTDCIVKSAKAECPICRAQLKLNKKLKARIDKLAQERRTEYLLQDEQQIYQNFQNQMSELMDTRFSEIFQETISDLLAGEEIENVIDAGGILHFIFAND